MSAAHAAMAKAGSYTIARVTMPLGGGRIEGLLADRGDTMLGCGCGSGRRSVALLAVVCLASVFLLATQGNTFESGEVLRYEVSWNGNKAGHGDVTTTRDASLVKVMAQAVSDGPVKKILEIWSRVQATFTLRGFKPQQYSFILKSNLGGIEGVDLSFNHDTSLVQVNKRKGDERESHAEKFAGTYDPITAIYLLRSQKDLTKPLFVDIYDGKDRSRLFVNRVGEEQVQVKTGLHSAVCLSWRLAKLGHGMQELATGKLWISNDRNRVPLLLTSSPVVGTIRLELVQAQLGGHRADASAEGLAPHTFAGFRDARSR